MNLIFHLHKPLLTLTSYHLIVRFIQRNLLVIDLYFLSCSSLRLNPKERIFSIRMVKDNYVKHSLKGLALVSLLLFLQRSEATTFTVGGSNGWAVPSDNKPVFNQWAEKMRFQIDDSLLFVYPSATDSVLRVNKDDYDNCNTNSPMEKYTDGHTVLKLNQSGPHYFISGNKDNCQKNEKLLVVVLADRTKKTSALTQSPPSPAPAQSPPSLAPSTVVPAPAPTAADQPAASQPPTDTTEAPSAESHPPSAAASIVMSFVGSIGAFVGSSLLLGL